MKSSSGQGDELVHVNVQTPETLTPKERDLIAELSKEFEADKPKRW
jgi:DnaJ-class molecular chaperone